MQLSEKTLKVLKNFSENNQSILVKPGNILQTISNDKTVFIKATIEEEFESKLVIYDLPRFLSVYGLFDNPKLELNENHCIISGNNRQIKYYFADEEMIVFPPDKAITAVEKLKEDKPVVSFNLTRKDIDDLKKASAALGFEEVAVVVENGSISIQILNSSDRGTDTFTLDLDGNAEEDCKYFFSINALRILPEDYKISIVKKGIANFSANNIDYYLAVKTISTTE